VVETLVSGIREPGTYAAAWNAGNRPAGIYLIHLTAGNLTANRKIVLVK
jgi:hypothetical protein